MSNAALTFGFNWLIIIQCLVFEPYQYHGGRRMEVGYDPNPRDSFGVAPTAEGAAWRCWSRHRPPDLRYKLAGLKPILCT